MIRVGPGHIGSVAAAGVLLALLTHGCGLNTSGGGLDASFGGAGGSTTGGSGGSSDASIDVIDTGLPDAQTPDVPCFPPNKACGAICAEYDDPSYGCANPANPSKPCAPCPVPLHGVATCRNNECAFECAKGWSDCDQTPTNGCETDITKVTDCDGCGNTCTPANATPACIPDVGCDIGACNDFWEDCNDNPADGCEQDLRDRDNCGGCNTPCHNQGATTYTCATGMCLVDTCPAGYANCDDDPSNGCEMNIRTTTNCGVCGKACSASNAQMGCADVGGGVWDCVISACTGNFGDCDGQPGNGCEVDKTNNVNHCGSCGGPCSSSNVTTRICAGGLCDPACSGGFDDCDGPEPGQGDNGCELPVSGDPTNCSGCNIVCPPIPHASSTCTNGICGYSCLLGWGDCTATQGCETDLNQTVSRCGSCDNACPTPPNTTAACIDGTCGFTCKGGWGDCTAEPGCETKLSSTPDHCGSCDDACPVPPNATATCNKEKCGFTCNTGFRDCTSAPGCETNIYEDESHCGGCNYVCTAELNATATCVGGACEQTCNPGWADCDGIDGCDCPTLGFSCGGGKCACATDDTCSNGGTCSGTTGLCSCGTTTCGAGEICISSTTCG